MKTIANFLDLLKKPFPETDNWADYLRNLSFISLFVAFFLYVFQPFGISTIETGKLWKCMGFGAMTFLGASLFHWIYTILSKGKLFTFGRWLIYMTGIMFTIGIGNFLYARMVFFGNIRWEFFPNMLYGTFMVGFFPMVILGIIALLRQENKYMAVAEEMNENREPISPAPPNTPTLFDIPLEQVRYIEALQNYVRIGYFDHNEVFREQTERSTLKDILAQVQGTPIARCHRSYLVNRSVIAHVSGNAQGLVLTLSDCDKTIPVSRSFVPGFRSA